MVGLKAHWIRTKVERKSLKKDDDAKAFESLIVSALVSLPGEGGAAASAGGSAVTDKAIAAVEKFLAAAGKKGVKKADLPVMVLGDAELLADPDRDAILTMMVTDDSFLNAGPWKFSGGVIKAQ